MTSSWPLSKDSFTTKIDNTDDVMASHINNPQDSIVAIEDLRDYSLMRVKNTSGAAVAADDLVRLTEAGEAKTTATAYDDQPYAVVVAGAANNADIIIVRRGRATVTLDGNCGVGDFLYASSTAKQATTEIYMRPEVLGVALTANTSGVGGTCAVLLLPGRIMRPLTASDDILRINSSSDSDWRSTQNGAVAGAVVTYNVALTSGAEDSIVPVSATEVGKLVLHNTTRGETALIQAVNIGANTITVTAAADIAAWVNTNVLVVRSQTNTDSLGGATVYFYDVEIEDTNEIPMTAVALGLFVNFRDSGAASQALTLHPWVAGATAKRKSYASQVANVYRAMADAMVPLNQRKFTLARDASGAGTFTTIIRLQYVILAVP